MSCERADTETGDIGAIRPKKGCRRAVGAILRASAAFISVYV